MHGGKVDAKKVGGTIYCENIYTSSFSGYSNFLEFCFAQKKGNTTSTKTDSNKSGSNGGSSSSSKTTTTSTSKSVDKTISTKSTTSKSSTKFLSVAKELHNYIATHNYTYYSNSKKPSDYEKEAKNGGGGEMDCTSYVNWVLYRYTNGSWNINGYPAYLATEARLGTFKKYGFTTIEPPRGQEYLKQSDCRAGDIIICEALNGDKNKRHAEIYIGNGKSYSCGSNESIKSKSGITTNFKNGCYKVALRPNK